LHVHYKTCFAIAIFLIFAALSLHPYKKTYVDMLHLQHARDNTRSAVEQFVRFKAEGFEFVAFVPDIEILDNKFVWLQQRWHFVVLSKFVACFSGDYDFSSRDFIRDLSNEDQSLLPKNNIYVYHDKDKLKDFIVGHNDRKVAFIEINGHTKDYYTVDPALGFAWALNVHWWYTVHLSDVPHVIQQQLNVSFTNTMDIRNTPYLSAKGFSGPENWGRWTDGNQAAIMILLPDSLKNKAVRIELPLVHVLGEQRVIPSLNNRALPELRLDKPETLVFLATEAETATGRLTLAFDLPDAKSPASLGISADTRMLGIGFKELNIEQAP
jgi:hypothetical protein